MEEKIINILNKIFLCLKKSNLKSFEDLSNTKILYAIGLEINKNIFSQLELSITGENDLKTLISELSEISEAFINLLKSSEFIPTDKFKEEIELIDIIGLANKENKTIYNFSILILITVFYCAKNIFNSNNELFSEINNIINPYIIPQPEKNEENSDYKIKIAQLEKELKSEKERASKIKLFEEQYNGLKKRLSNMESKNASLMKELLESKNRIKLLEKTIEEKNNRMGILQSKLEEKNKLVKERDNQLNKEIETNMELKFKLEEITSGENNLNNLNNLNNKNKINNNTYDEIMKLNEDLKMQNNQLNEIIKVMENKLNSKEEKDYENIKNRYEKEFELMASAIYNLGFQFWSLKLEDSEKLKQNENWLVRERIKQYNGDY